MKRCNMCFRDPCACPVPAWIIFVVFAGLFTIGTLGVWAIEHGLLRATGLE